MSQDALDSNYFYGGDTYLDCDLTSIKRGNYHAGLTYSYAINLNHIIRFLAHKGVTTRLGSDSNIYCVGWSYRWK